MANNTVLIRNARIVDGSGSPWRYGDVALAGDRIAAIAPPGAIPTENYAEVVDAGDHVVCPGFVDILSHSILSLMVDGRSVSKISQGVTTEVMGEAWTPAPFGGRISADLPIHQFTQLLDPAWAERMTTWKRFRDWLEAMTEQGVSPNIGSFLGGGSVRKYAMGMDMRSPTADEMATMKRVIAEAMEDGAFGVSFALIYPPSSYDRYRRDRGASPILSSLSWHLYHSPAFGSRRVSGRAGGGALDRARKPRSRSRSTI